MWKNLLNCFIETRMRCHNEEKPFFKKKKNVQMVFELKAPCSTLKRNGPVIASSMVKPSAVPDLGGDRRKLKL